VLDCCYSRCYEEHRTTIAFEQDVRILFSLDCCNVCLDRHEFCVDLEDGERLYHVRNNSARKEDALVENSILSTFWFFWMMTFFSDSMNSPCSYLAALVHSGGQ
jgi:hypothetical protein